MNFYELCEISFIFAIINYYTYSFLLIHLKIYQKYYINDII